MRFSVVIRPEATTGFYGRNALKIKSPLRLCAWMIRNVRPGCLPEARFCGG